MDRGDSGGGRVVPRCSRSRQDAGYAWPERTGSCVAAVDLLLENAGDPAKALATVKAHRGHLAGAYLRLLRFLVQNKTGLRYSWAEPTSAKPNQSRSVTEAEAGPLVEVLSSVSNLGGESVALWEHLRKRTGARELGVC